MADVKPEGAANEAVAAATTSAALNRTPREVLDTNMRVCGDEVNSAVRNRSERRCGVSRQTSVLFGEFLLDLVDQQAHLDCSDRGLVALVVDART